MEQSKRRLFFLDNLKIFLVILVIVHHVGQAYGPTGGFWQYKSSLGESIPFLGAFFAVNAAFFMGLFFMISGYFFPNSYDRKGSMKFLVDKLLRYGIPLLFVFLIISPLQMYFYYINYSPNTNINFFEYYMKIYFGMEGKPSGFIESIGFPELNFAHMWFVEHLIIYAIIYIIIRKIVKVDIWSKLREVKVREFLIVLVVAILVTASTLIIRIWYPIDKWGAVFGFFQVELAHWPQYFILFVFGIISYRLNLFQRFSKSKGYLILGLGFIMILMVYIPRILYLMGIISDGFGVFVWNNWGIYESFMSVFICFGLIIFFREKFNSQNKISKWLSENSYAAYIIHFPIVLTVQYVLDKIVIGGAWGKFLVVSILSVVLTYILSDVVRRIPKAKKIV